MSESVSDIVIGALRRLLENEIELTGIVDRPKGSWDSKIWQKMTELGMTSIAAEYAEEGFDLAADVLVEIGRSSASVPFLEHDLLAGWVLSQGGIDPADGNLLTAVPLEDNDKLSIRRRGGSWHINGRAERVPYGRVADEIVVVFSLDGYNWAGRFPSENVRVIEEYNLADEMRDTLDFDDLVLPGTSVLRLPNNLTAERLKARGALGRCFQALGAMERAFTMTHEYARARIQFGRSLSDFQVIQGYLSEIAGEIAASKAICHVALKADSLEEIAAARIRVGGASQIVAERSHQIHGAIGFTQEYPLHLATRRLWSWREEFGNEKYWEEYLSSIISEAGPDALWALIVG